jgi:1-acyl-sn-glycerol-3-phosphate acyltransferase
MALLNKEYNILYWFSRGVVRAGFLLFSKLNVFNERNVPRKGGVLLVSNHISYLDPPLVGITCSRKVHFMAKKELFHSSFLKWYMSLTGQISVNRGKGKEAVDIAVELLKQGRCICIFPEGTRSKTGEMLEPRTGVVVLASKANVPIVPVFITGTFDMFPPGTKFPKLFRQVYIIYGEPFHLTDDENDLTSKDKMKQTANSIMDKVKDLKEQWSKAGTGNG